MPTRIFLHGLESSNQGTKAVYFRKHFPGMLLPSFTGDLDARLRDLEALLGDRTELRMVGSSFGGLMATIFAIRHPARVTRLILLAPAINLAEFLPYAQAEVALPTWVFHGRADGVIPLEAVTPVVRRTFRDLTFKVVDDDHYLHRTFPTLDWETLLA